MQNLCDSYRKETWNTFVESTKSLLTHYIRAGRQNKNKNSLALGACTVVCAPQISSKISKSSLFFLKKITPPISLNRNPLTQDI